jgi:uncharacterized protein (DUF983 family)
MVHSGLVGLQSGRLNPNSADMTQTARPSRDVMQAMARGFCGRCPNCGKGRLFRAFLKVVDRCEHCGEELSHHRADDAPAYFVVLIAGHIVVALALEVDWCSRRRIGFTLHYGCR